jgi:ferredoxin
MIKKIIVDPDLCIGCGTCAAIAPDVFEIDETGKSVVKNMNGADEETIKLAASSCPAKAILLSDENDEEVV